MGAEFATYDDYCIAFDAFCEENAVNGVPLSFTRQGSTKLTATSFKNHTVDQTTIDRFVYKNLAVVCSFHRTRSDANLCEGRISIRYIRERNVLQVTSFVGEHNHQAGNLGHEDSRLENIFTLIKQLPEDALSLVEQACQSILNQWGDENAGLSVVITPIKVEPDLIPVAICEAQLSGPETGEFDYGNLLIVLIATKYDLNSQMNNRWLLCSIIHCINLVMIEL